MKEIKRNAVCGEKVLREYGLNKGSLTESEWIKQRNVHLVSKIQKKATSHHTHTHVHTHTHTHTHAHKHKD